MNAVFRDMQGAVFDMDGTLLDSMGVWKEIDRDYLARFGIDAPAELQMLIQGMNVPETARFFQDHFGIRDSIEVIMADWNEMAAEAYGGRLPLKEGARELLERLKARGFRLGLATSNYRDLTENCLEALGIRELFDGVVTTEDVSRGKPDPEGFLKAAERMGVAPERCVMFEDLPAGLEAGRRAGMRRVAVFDPSSEEQEREKRRLSDLFVYSLKELLEEL